MGKRSSDEQTATVGIFGSERRIYEVDETGTSFDYDVFCKNIMKVAKRKLDACLLLPLKYYHDNTDFAVIMDFVKLDMWMNVFSTNAENFFYVWSYITYEGGGRLFEKWSKGNESTIAIGVNAIESAKGHLGDATKLKDSKYIKRMYENRDAIEAWILNAYEVTFKKIYKASQMALLMHDIISYLNICGLDIRFPIFVQQDRDENEIFQIAANVMLLVMRVRFAFPKNEVIEWYKSGNVGYSMYADQMLSEYMCLVGDYYYNSYERFVGMKKLVEENKNKYAAKEIGDIYSLGGELQDIYGNKILITENKEKACDFYRICVEYEYLPAYAPAIKTNCLIESIQKERLREKAFREKAPLELVQRAKENIVEADNCIQKDMHKASLLVENAVNSIALLKCDYGEKYVIKNMLIFSKSFRMVKEAPDKYSQMAEYIQKGFSCNVFALNDEELSKEIEENYLLAGKLGYYKAEYKLAKYFQDKNIQKSKQYVIKGKEKGCKYCMLEYSSYKENVNQDEWLDIMLYLGKSFSNDVSLLILIAEAWIRNESFFDAIASDDAIGLNKVMEMYLQINNIINEIDGKLRASETKIATQGKLYMYLNKLKVIIKERVME